MGKNQNNESISDSEIRVLQVLWDESPLTAQGIIDKLSDATKAHPRTIKTLINRLLNKGAIGYHEKNRKYHYFPEIKKADFYQQKTEAFLEQFFNGEVTPLVSFFSRQKKLDEKDLSELKKLIEQMEADDGN